MEDKINKIYEVISNKGLVFWMKLIYKVNEWHYRTVRAISKNHKTNEYLVQHEYNYFHPRGIKESQIVNKLWHPIMIWDVLDYYIKNIKIVEFELDKITKTVIFTDIDYIQILSYWEKLREPIEKQSDECIEYIYDLINSINW